MTNSELQLLQSLKGRVVSKAFAAAYLSRSKKQIDRLCAAGKLTFIQEPRRRKFRLSDLEAYLTERTIVADQITKPPHHTDQDSEVLHG